MDTSQQINAKTTPKVETTWMEDLSTKIKGRRSIADSTMKGYLSTIKRIAEEFSTTT